LLLHLADLLHLLEKKIIDYGVEADLLGHFISAI
jgi:hypothetical protein